MKIIPKFLNGGWVREKSNHPVSYDDLGYLTDQITGEKGTLVLPEVTVYDKGIYRDIWEKRLNQLRQHSEIDPITKLPKVIGARSVYPEFDILSGFRGLLNTLYLKPRAALNFSKSEPFESLIYKYLGKDGLWNTDLIGKEVKLGWEDAINYFKSDLRKEVNNRNTKEAVSLGYREFLPNIESASRVSIKPLFKYEVNPNTTVLASITRPGENASDDILTINLTGDDISNSTFHEMLHRGSLGVTEPRRPNETIKQFISRVKANKGYYLWKTDLLLRPREEVPINLRDFYDYISDAPEAAANYFELGRRLGLKPGTPFPGEKEAIDFITKNVNNPAIKGKGPLVLFANSSKEGLKRFWDAITGQYFFMPYALPFAGTANMLYGNTNLDNTK